MSKLKFNYTYISTNIIPNINAAISELDSLVKKNDTIFIPRDFYYYNYLKEYKEQVRLIKGFYEDKLEFLTTSNKKLDSTLDTLNNDLLSLKQAEIKFRGNTL